MSEGGARKSARGRSGKGMRPKPKGETDGRVLRSVRSRERILDAIIELVGEGDLQPTGERVAARAGYGLRTVYRHFEDMEGLYREVQAHVQKLVRPTTPRPVREGSLEERVAALVEWRVEVFERAAPFLRSGASLRWRSAFLAQAHGRMVRELRDDLTRSLPEVVEHREVVEVLTSWEVWDSLRTDQKLGREKARRVLESAVRALLSPRPRSKRQ